MFEDFFTTYSMVEPPKIYKDNPDLAIRKIEESDITEYPIETIDNSTIDIQDYPGIYSPFEQSFEDIYSFEDFSISNQYKPNNDLLKLDIEDLLKQEGITEINGKPIKFGNKALRTSGNPNSWHRKKDSQTGNASARDISIVGGTSKDYSDFKNILLHNQNIQDWMQLKNWGIINEITPEILSQTKGTGNHFHFGPDIWARNTWKAWNDNPSAKVTTSFRYYKSSNTSNNKEFVVRLNNAYRKALQNKGLDPNYASMLVAQDVNETTYGKDINGNYNYGNLTAKENEPWHRQTGKRKWRDFSSMEDYVNSKIEFLQRNRYRFFETFNANSNIAVAMQTLANRGYDPGNTNYGKSIQNTYNTVIKYLSS